MTATSTAEARAVRPVATPARMPGPSRPRRSQRRSAARADQARAAQRRRSTSVVVVLVVMVLVATAITAVIAVRSAPYQVGIGQPVTYGDLQVTVVDVSRRVDAVAGVNAERMPMGGPAMPMNSMGAGAMDHDGQDGGMARMPGMAGVLEAGQERIDLRVSIVNRRGAGEPMDARAFGLSSLGRPVRLLQPTASDLPTTSVPPGFTLTGQLTFVVPEGTSPLELRYGDAAGRVLLDAAQPGQHTHSPGSSGHGH